MWQGFIQEPIEKFEQSYSGERAKDSAGNDKLPLLRPVAHLHPLSVFGKKNVRDPGGGESELGEEGFVQ